MQKTIKILMLTVLLLGVTLSACSGPASTDIVSLTTATSTRPSASPTTKPTHTPSPTPTPIELVSAGEHALFVGDYDRARELFQNTLTQAGDPVVRAQSQLGLGQAWYWLGEYGLALDQLLPASEAEDPVTAGRAFFIQAQAFSRLERYDEALEAYQSYLEIRPGLLDSTVHTLRGDIFSTLGNYPQAINAYEQAYLTEPSGGTEALALEIARAYQNAGQVDTALMLYQDLVNTTSNDYTKAEMDLRIGQIFLDRGEPDAAYPYLQDAVNTVPYAYDAYTALVILVEAGIAVDEYQRGLVNYFVGNYNLAVEAFDRYLASGAQTKADAALYHKALATRALGSADDPTPFETAITLWEQLIVDFPNSEYYVDAWQDVEFTLWAYLGEPQRAAEHALRYLAQRPESPEAPDFLFLAGRSYERAGLLQEAAAAWTRIADEYPSAVEAFRSTYFAGIAYVRLGDWVTAEAMFSRALVLTSEPAQVAAAHLWIGKCQEALGDISAALESWKIAQTTDPFGHYSIRAEDLLIDQGVFTEPESFNLDPDLDPYRMEAESWLRQTFNLPADINLESPGLLANDPRFQRGLEFWSLGNYPAAKAEFEDLRLEFASDPAQTFRLIPALVDIDLYRSALVASTELIKLAGLEGAQALDAPEFFSRVRFGAYYLDWLIPIAEDEEISPLLLLAIIRQESTFEGFISSGAGARGLMQIMPSTGAQLAEELDWPADYTVEDLDRPYVSLVFGANYLRKQRNYFDGDLFAMLAAYNGGPGNTIAWKELTPIDDPDMFLEIIRIEETRNYIRLINEIHHIYKWLYGENLP